MGPWCRRRHPLASPTSSRYVREACRSSPSGMNKTQFFPCCPFRDRNRPRHWHQYCLFWQSSSLQTWSPRTWRSGWRPDVDPLSSKILIHDCWFEFFRYHIVQWGMRSYRIVIVHSHIDVFREFIITDEIPRKYVVFLKSAKARFNKSIPFRGMSVYRLMLYSKSFQVLFVVVRC